MELMILALFGLFMILMALICLIITILHTRYSLKKDIYLFSKSLSNKTIEEDKDNYSLFLAHSIKRCLEKLGE